MPILPEAEGAEMTKAETRYINGKHGRTAYVVHRGPDGRIIRADIPKVRVGLRCACHDNPKGPCGPVQGER